jgi:DNA (cytosine-5)-methyltransferase 1
MNYLSVCSGIEAATVAWHDIGWNPVGFSEIEKFPSELLQHHYSHVTNYGDMTKFKEWKLNDTIGLLVGGTPCQSFSVAGLRKGLEDPRGNLMLTYLGIADYFKPKWILWENVPGVLSSNGGKDFACFLQGLAELRYGFAYRVLDAQHFGVPQRRRRVFVVGCLGDWRSAAKVLFESESLCRDITPSRSEKQKVTGTLTRGFGDRGYDLDQIASGGYKIENSKTFIPDIANCIQTTCNDYSRADGFNMIALAENTIGRKPLNGGNGNGFTVNGPMYTLNATGVHGVAQTYTFPADMNFLPSFQPNVSNTLIRKGNMSVTNNMRVRRLLPIECERLQGFPDNYTKTPTSSDTTRYRALGNSMAVPVMKWIGQRINELS